MKVVVTIRGALGRCTLGNWDKLCNEIGLNSWCMNEGLADGDDEVTLSMETARKYGFIS